MDIMKLGVREAGLSATDQKFFWRSVMSKLMESFNVGVSPPPAVQVLEEIRKPDQSAA
jgi:hypothetical protein